MKRHDHLRRALMLEPRGHADMYGAILTEPVTAGSHAGVLFMHNEGYSTMCGHGIIAVTTIALERGLITARHRDEIALRRAGRDGSVRATRIRAQATRTASAGARRSSVRQRAVVRASRRAAGDGRRRARSASTSPSAAPSTPSSTPKRWACRSMPARLPELRRVGMEIKHASRAAAPRRAPDRRGAARASTARSSPGRPQGEAPTCAT